MSFSRSRSRHALFFVFSQTRIDKQKLKERRIAEDWEKERERENGTEMERKNLIPHKNVKANEKNIFQLKCCCLNYSELGLGVVGALIFSPSDHF